MTQKNTVEIVSKHKNPSLIDIGDIITLEMNDDVFDVILTGKFLANSKIGEITLNSPIGKAVFMKKEGDEISFVTHNNQKSFMKVLKVQKQK